ncbi:nuclease [Synechococcus sp. CS-1328]|uniref:nuclease n=1 Tax=Synechococcus sp. CS-1328 TaxID=2847976 RepID=UPI00223AF5ED|nr:nuclease [Synechococcus sp. CS-1328]MCT0225158.1 nuclease [Synechococcus sp. CS-1328]
MMVPLLGVAVPAAAAADVLQVRSGTLLQVGDGNRNYEVELACIQVEPEQQQAAQAWLRQQLPRRTAVNLRPLGQQQGRLQARVRRIGSSGELDAGLIAAGLAEQATAAPEGCPV